MLKITLVKSPIAGKPVNRKTVAALGLRKTGRTVYHQDSPSIRGMIHNVAHLLKVETVDSAPAKSKKAKTGMTVVFTPEPKAKVEKTKPVKKKAAPAPKPAAPKKEEAKPAAKKPAAKKPAAAEAKPAAKKPAAKKADTDRKSFGQIGKTAKKK